jgi:hypothetical protein
VVEPNESRASCVARYIRYSLMLAIAGMLALILLDAPWRGEQRFRVRSAYADGFGAAPGVIALTLGGSGGGSTGEAGTGGGGGGGGTANRFFIIDTAKNVICVYTMTGEKIRLVNARKYDTDTDILDASLDVGGIRSFEGGNGLSRVEAKAYAEGLKKLMEASQAKR